MTLSHIIALFSAMVVLASIPSLSVLIVATRSATFGLMHGVLTTLGIVVGDIVLIIIAIWGLSFLVTTMDSGFVCVKYLGGAYLIWLGVGLCKSKSQEIELEERVDSSLCSSFLTGLSITLADQKATLFYLGFFPAFLDLSKLSLFDTGIIVATTIVAVGGVKFGYAWMAARVRLLIRSKTSTVINLATGSMMIAVGVFLFIKA